MGELREQLSNLTQSQISERLLFLTDSQRSEFRKLMTKVLITKFPEDEYDKKLWTYTQFQIFLSLPLIVSARFVSEYVNANYQFSKMQPTLWVKFLRAIAFKKGIGLSSALLVIPMHKIFEYSRKMAYKQFILTQIKED